MNNGTNEDRASLGMNAERPDQDEAQPHPEKSIYESRANDAAREATRRYVERVDRYLARPDVITAGRNAAPSSSS